MGGICRTISTPKRCSVIIKLQRTTIYNNFVAMASFPNPCVPIFVFLLVMLGISRAYASNVLVTGQTLEPGENISYADIGVSLVMQINCDLVLGIDYGEPIWSSNSTCLSCGPCNLSFSDNGRLLIRDHTGHQRWVTPNKKSKVGKYVAILRPEVEVAIYGPGIWSVGPGLERSSSNYNKMMSSMNSLENRVKIYNALFSGQVLHNNHKLSDNGYKFILKDCELILEDDDGGTPWRSWTKGYGDNCFAELSHTGKLTIRDEDFSLIWSNQVSRSKGEYLLVLLQNGNVVIYGPKAWSSEETPNSEFIEMAVAKKID